MNARERPALEHAAVERKIARTIRPDVRSLSAYAVAKADGMIKLDAMENPYGLPAAVRARIGAAAANVHINRYPDGHADELKAALRAAIDLPDDLGIVLGNGSDELIQMLTTLVAVPDACVLAPEPSFVMYRLNAEFARVRFAGVPLRSDFTLDEAAMLDAIRKHRPALIWIAYPNNPTGNLFDAGAVARIIDAAPGLVAVDEAYYAFADQSFLPRVLDFPNLIVVRTLSKIGMAGLRLGYAVAHPAWTREIDKVRPPYNINAMTQAIVPVLLAEGKVLQAQADAICAERERLIAGLSRLTGVQVFQTRTNFVLARVPEASAWFATLRAAGILIKNLHGSHPLLANCLRVTVGTPEENAAVLKALEGYA